MPALFFLFVAGAVGTVAAVASAAVLLARQQRSVVVIGGGIAGLCAAIEAVGASAREIAHTYVFMPFIYHLPAPRDACVLHTFPIYLPTPVSYVCSAILFIIAIYQTGLLVHN